MTRLAYRHVRLTPLIRHGIRAVVVVLLATTGYLVVRYQAVPWLLPVHFRQDGAPNGWQYKTIGRVFMPLFVQLALTLTLGGIAALLLSRSDEGDPDTPDRRAAATAAEAVVLITTIWVTFQAYAAVALIGMWTRGHDNLGSTYSAAEIIGFFLTAVVGIRARALLARPTPLPYVAAHWRFGQLYKNSDDPALFVPTRDGSRWTLNFGRPVAVVLLAAILLAGAVVPTVLLALALRS